MRALGLLCGVGSLLREAQDAGFEIDGNIETRTPFLTVPDVWQLNFPGLPLTKGDDAKLLKSWREPDLVIGHPPCNSQSTLGHMKHPPGSTEEQKEAWRRERASRMGLLPLFTEHVRNLRPRMFVLDNLPKVLERAAPPAWWEAELPGYRLSYLIIANYDYGTPQLRKRLWVVGTRSKTPFTFVPPKQRLVTGYATGWDAIKDLPWEPWINLPKIAHVHKAVDAFPAGGYMTTDDPPDRAWTQDHLAYNFLQLPPKHSWPYRTKTGRIAYKVGRTRMPPSNDRSRVLSGMETIHHPLTGWPLTPRERARLMNWPDDFKLWNGQREFDRSYLMRLVLFTGKAVPSAFPRYLMPQLIKHLKRS